MPFRGQFLQVDPLLYSTLVGFAYAYGAHAPAILFDPTGLAPCGQWSVTDVMMKIPEEDESGRQVATKAGLDPDNILGFEVQFDPDAGTKKCNDCCAKDDIVVVQAVLTNAWGVGPAHFEKGLRENKITKKDKGFLPPGYVQGGGPKGEKPLSHRDAPANSGKGEKPTTHKFEVCAYCRKEKQNDLLGCVAFEFYDQPNPDDKKDKRHSFVPGGKWNPYPRAEKDSEDIAKGGVWQTAQKEWDKAAGTEVK